MVLRFVSRCHTQSGFACRIQSEPSRPAAPPSDRRGEARSYDTSLVHTLVGEGFNMQLSTSRYVCLIPAIPSCTGQPPAWGSLQIKKKRVNAAQRASTQLGHGRDERRRRERKKGRMERGRVIGATGSGVWVDAGCTHGQPLSYLCMTLRRAELVPELFFFLPFFAFPPSTRRDRMASCRG